MTDYFQSLFFVYLIEFLIIFFFPWSTDAHHKSYAD